MLSYFGSIFNHINILFHSNITIYAICHKIDYYRCEISNNLCIALYNIDFNAAAINLLYSIIYYCK